MQLEHFQCKIIDLGKRFWIKNKHKNNDDETQKKELVVIM